jgi:hypothetical protein
METDINTQKTEKMKLRCHWISAEKIKPGLRFISFETGEFVGEMFAVPKEEKLKDHTNQQATS